MKNMYFLGKVLIGIVILIFILCVATVAYILYIKWNMPIWQIVIALGTPILIPSIATYALIRVNKNNSPDDYKREQQVMDDVIDVRQGKFLNTKTILGRWYLVAIIFIFIFPLLAGIVRSFVSSPDKEIDIILSLGLFFIILFIVIIVWKGRKRNQ